jgi:hypothetical protein
LICVGGLLGVESFSPACIPRTFYHTLEHGVYRRKHEKGFPVTAVSVINFPSNNFDLGKWWSFGKPSKPDSNFFNVVQPMQGDAWLISANKERSRC